MPKEITPPPKKLYCPACKKDDNIETEISTDMEECPVCGLEIKKCIRLARTLDYAQAFREQQKPNEPPPPPKKRKGFFEL